MQSYLRRHDWPAWLTTLILVLLVVGVLVVIRRGGHRVAARLASTLPQYADHSNSLLHTNYLPNVGFIIGVVPPALLALITSGVPEMLVVIGVYCGLNVVIQTLIQPRFVGDSVGDDDHLRRTGLLDLVDRTIGALLAMPLTLLAKALLVDVDPAARWATALAGNLSPEPKAARPPLRGQHDAGKVPAAVAPAAPSA